MNTPDIEVVKVEKVERGVDKADWNNDNRHALIMAVLDLVQNREGGEDSNGFKKKEWLSILTSFNSSTGLKYNRQQLQSQLSILKAAYTSFKKVSDNSGFGWDEDLKIPTAPESYFLGISQMIESPRHCSRVLIKQCL
jgi:hypothetical protein